MGEPFAIDGLCICGHDPREDPNEDCERCWLVTRIDDLTNQTVEDTDVKNMLRDELATLRERAGGLEAELRRSADRFRSFASHCREFAWGHLGSEFDGFARDCDAALAIHKAEPEYRADVKFAREPDPEPAIVPTSPIPPTLVTPSLDHGLVWNKRCAKWERPTEVPR